LLYSHICHLATTVRRLAHWIIRTWTELIWQKNTANSQTFIDHDVWKKKWNVITDFMQ